MTDDKLRNIRARIDALDEQIQKLINERAVCAQEVARLKHEDGKAVFYRPEREAEVLRKVMERNTGPMGNEEMARLFREIMSACLAMQRMMRIAFLGPEGTFTQAAALKHFGHFVHSVPHLSIEEVFRDVESGDSDYGVVPVENSTEGVVTHTLDRFVTSPLKITGEVQLRIHQCLLGKGDDIARIKRVYSHRQSLGQCHEWLESHLPGIERIAVNSNAEAARRAAAEPEAAAIAGTEAAGIYKLNILARNIEDEPDNTTRFLVIGKPSSPPSGNDKTSLMLSARNEAGALFHLLEPLARNGISMTRIESRPSRQKMWEYLFFVDIDGHAEEPKMAQALRDLEREALFLKVLGSYPKAIL